MKRKRYYTPEEIGDFFNVSAETIRNLARDGKIQGATQVGRQWRIPHSYLVETAGYDPTEEPEDHRPAKQ